MKKFFCTIFVALMLCAVSESLTPLNETRKHCFEELKLNPTDTELVVSRKYLEKAAKDLPKNMLCFPRCVYKGIGFIDDKEVLNLTRIEEAYVRFVNGDKPRVTAMMEKCKYAAKGADDCEKAFNNEICYKQYIK